MKLASVERIIDLQPIEGADFIQKATVLGWEIVVKKDEFKIGDLAGYIQIDTVVPEKPQFEFLRERQFRVRTIKLRKQISQGLLVPLPPVDDLITRGVWQEGDDLTTLLGVRKFEKGGEIPGVMPRKPKVWYKRIWFMLKYKYLVKLFPSLNTFNRNRFPTDLVSITDEERIQNMPSILDRYKDKPFTITEKLDGSSITIIYTKGKFRICSRRFELFDIKNEYHAVFESTGFAKHLIALAKFYDTKTVIVQGEYIGKPQGNKYGLTANEIRVFNIYAHGKRVAPIGFDYACQTLGIPRCPKVDSIPLSFTLPEILKYAEGKSKLNPNTEREGLVFRSDDGLISFKVISNKFLLKNDE